MTNRRKTRTVQVGSIEIGGNTPISIQSMTNTRTDDIEATVKQIRELVVFAEQNLISDAPFSKLDLISCRNLLIYLEPEVQQKVISLFHFALNEEGHLFLGSSETVGRHVDLFETVSKKWRVFRRAERSGCAVGLYRSPGRTPSNTYVPGRVSRVSHEVRRGV